MGWRRAANTSCEVVDLFLKWILAQGGILYVESDNELVINCFEQRLGNIEQLDISAREQQWQAGPPGKGSKELNLIAKLLRGSDLSEEVDSLTIFKHGENIMYYDRNQRQSRVLIVVQVCDDEACLNSSQEVKSLSQDQVPR